MLDFVQKWKDKITSLIETKVRMMQLDLIERVSGAMSYFILILFFIFLGFGLFLFLGLGFAEVLTSLLDSRIGGYFAAALFFMLLGFILYTQRKKIIRKLSDNFIAVLTKDDEEEEQKQ